MNDEQMEYFKKPENIEELHEWMKDKIKEENENRILEPMEVG